MRKEITKSEAFTFIINPGKIGRSQTLLLPKEDFQKTVDNFRSFPGFPVKKVNTHCFGGDDADKCFLEEETLF